MGTGQTETEAVSYRTSFAHFFCVLMLTACGHAFGARPQSSIPAAPTYVQPISYELDLREPSSHRVHVTMTVPEPGPDAEIQFPTWTALYQIRDFVRNVQGLRAECAGRPTDLQAAVEGSAVDLNSWRIGMEPCPTLAVRYDVYLNGEPPFSSSLNAEHGFFNFAMLLFYLPRQRDRAVRVRFAVPEGWRVATLLEDTAVPGEYQAANYDALTDSPAEAGNFQEYSYTDGGATYRVIVHADPSDYSPERLLKSLQAITSTETALMQETPFSRYTFIFHFPHGPAGGGMEHKNGTAINVRAAGLRSHLEGVESMAAHEFFHVWNVKRIRPQRLEPVDYVHGNNTSDLWFSEGVTNTYGELALLRAGLRTRQEFYSEVAEEIKELESRPARHVQSAEESGREAWLEKYVDYSRPERSISYYNKGELLGFLLDLGMRHATHNRRGLDDVMRGMNEEFAHHARCFTQADLRALIARLSPEFSARNAFFQDYVRGTNELDFSEYLGYAGLRLSTLVREAPNLGFLALHTFDGPVRVESVEPGTEAEQAGLRTGDILVSMNGRPLEGLPQDNLEREKPGREVRFTVRRGRETAEVKFRLGRKQETFYRIQENSNATAEELAVREGWLTGRTD